MSRPGFTLCIGPDSALLKDRIASELARHPAPGGASWETHVFWGDEPLSEAFWERLTLQGLFAVPRAVILRQAEALPIEQWRRLSAALGEAREHVWPFICLEVDFEKGRPKVPAALQKLKAVSFAAQQGWVAEVPPLNASGVSAFAAKEAARLGLKAAPGAMAALARALPPVAAAIRLEMEKIALACPDGQLTAEAAALSSHSQEQNIFAFLKELQSGRRPEQAWEQLAKDLADEEGAIFRFLWVLTAEARTLWQLLSGENVYVAPALLAEKTALAKQLGFARLGRIWDLALKADKGIKSGEQRPDQAYEFLTAELFRLFAA